MDAATPGLYATLITSVQRVGDAASLWPLAQRLTGSIRQQIALGTAHLLFEFLPPVEQFSANEAGVETFCGLMARGLQTSLLSNAGCLAPLPALPGIEVDARSFALCPTPTQPVFTAVTTDNGRMTIHLDYNAAQLDDADAGEMADSMAALLNGAAAAG